MSAVELPFGEREAWNPYFAAYARSLGVAPGDVERTQAANARYMGWIRRQWAAWCDLTGVTNDVERARRQPEFAAWLDAEYPVGLIERATT